MNFHVADGREFCGFSFVLELVSSVSKLQVHSVVAGEVEPWSWHAAGNLRVVVFFCAPLVMLRRDLLILSSAYKNS
jgi:hypothetical protein